MLIAHFLHSDINKTTKLTHMTLLLSSSIYTSFRQCIAYLNFFKHFYTLCMFNHSCEVCAWYEYYQRRTWERGKDQEKTQKELKEMTKSTLKKMVLQLKNRLKEYATSSPPVLSTSSIITCHHHVSSPLSLSICHVSLPVPHYLPWGLAVSLTPLPLVTFIFCFVITPS